uniref:Odorant-binding protein 36 n=1 Tax=Pyrrhalta maculicollis TaxID=226885 RepID=A0A1J0KKD9_9CUCU|nr:odorant-binding protein 36 [Pyrrhalta maculicollis]
MKLLASTSILVILLISSSFGLIDYKRFGKKFTALIYRSHRLCKDTTGVSQQLIDGVKVGQFPDNEPSIQSYTFCLWAATDGLFDDNYKFNKDVVNDYLSEINAIQDADKYLTCNENALKLDGTPTYKVWEMEKCIYKNVPTENFIYF